MRNDSQSLAFLVWLRLQHQQTAKPVRPAFYDDNVFSLLPGETRRVNIHCKASLAGEVQLVVDGWNIESEVFLSPLRAKVVR
ncbi:MAG: hypothetical protein QM813_07580 [Verrucomicrobiota bacterium]